MYSIIDIESNGAGYRQESIIEVAIYRYDGHEIIDQFISLVNPESDITPFVQKLTKITSKMVKTAPKFHEIAKRIVEITEDTILVGHNIEFDYRMLRQSFKRLGYDYKINTLDTIPLAKKLISDLPSYSLSKLCKSIGIPLSDAHRASGDARATLDLFRLLISKDTENEIIQEHHEEVNAKTYVNKIRDLTQDLPSEKGIFYFQNKLGKIIYCDFVEDIYKCAKNVFNSKSRRWKNLQKETEHISYELTGNEIIGNLILKNKGIRRKIHHSYGLFYRNEKYIIEKFKKIENEQPLLKFKTFSQALKVYNYVESKEEFNDIQQFKDKITFKGRNQLLISKGRTLGEKSFLIIEKGKLSGYGFYELFHQIKSYDKIKNLKIEVHLNPEITNEVKLSLLKNDFEILPLPEK